MRLYRAAFDAVGSGAGTLRAAGLWMRVGDDLVERRSGEGRAPNPLGVVIAGSGSVPVDAHWFTGDEPRLLFVGAANPLTHVPPRTELIRSADEQPTPHWVLDRLYERGIRSLLVEGGPRLNASFLEAGLIDEMYWTVGAHLLGTDALPMIAPLPGERTLRHGRLASVMRHDSELFLRYQFEAPASIGP